MAEVLRSGEINPPDDAPLPNDDIPHPFVYLADDAFALKSNMMRPYSRSNFSLEEKIANYRISCGRRAVKNAFGILALRWQCLLSTMQHKPNVVQVIVKCTFVLHNLMRSRYPVHHQVLMDRKDDNGQVTLGTWRKNANMHDMEQVRSPSREAIKAKKEREYYFLYFNSPAGSVPWQERMV